MKNKAKKELAVCGFEAVKALAKIHPEKINRLYFDESHKFDFGEICRTLASRKAPYNIVKDAAELEKLCGSVHHQGVVAMIAQPEIMPLTKEITVEWLHKKESALILDRVGNANNLGAIVRSAAFFGMKNIVIPMAEQQASVTTSSYRIAQGGMEFVNIYSVRSIPFLLKDMKGKMARFGTSLKAQKKVSEMKLLCQEKPALVVLGNEEKGISEEVAQNCDSLVIIPFAGMGEAGPKVDSLNVAQAASVIMYELKK